MKTKAKGSDHASKHHKSKEIKTEPKQTKKSASAKSGKNDKKKVKSENDSKPVKRVKKEVKFYTHMINHIGRIP